MCLYLSSNGKSNKEVKMPVVHVNCWEGIGEEKVKKMIRGVTKAIADVGIPAHAVEVIVHEIPKTHWGIGDDPASEKLKDVSPPK
jgi:4-oxalocrotonate tautomerase